MKTIEIYGKSFTGAAAHTRIACRGLILRGTQILLSHEHNTGWYLIPGGGLEEGETPEEGCIREMREETGFLVEPAELLLTIREPNLAAENAAYEAAHPEENLAEDDGSGTQVLPKEVKKSLGFPKTVDFLAVYSR